MWDGGETMTRLIDADALKEQVCLDGDCTQCKTGVNEKVCKWNMVQLNDVIERLESAPTVDAEPRWIPCGERLPENSNTVLITKKSVFGNDNVVCFGWYIGDNHWAIINYKEPNVIAWMPLPDPYVGERKDNG